MHPRHFLLQLWAALLLALGLAASASAQPVPGVRDDGQFQIQQAVYGSARNSVDVTARLRELARSDRSVRTGNDTFGVDPDPGQAKTLRIQARGRDGLIRIFEFPEGASVDGAQFVGWTGGNFGDAPLAGTLPGTAPAGEPARPRDDSEFQIMQALYGTARANIDVTMRLRELARADRTVRLNNAIFGADPDPGQPKTLRIYARGRDGQIRHFDYAENGVVDGSLFTGWGRGSFGEGGYRGVWQAPGGDAGRRAGGRDEGEFRVLQALYGTARRNVDVTDQLRALARSDDELRVTRAAFNVDPDPGRPKTLRIFARGRDDRVRMFEFAPGAVVDGTQFRGWRGGDWANRDAYRVTWNGEVQTTTPPAPVAAPPAPTLRIVSATWGSGARKRDVTDRVRAQIHNGRVEALVDESLTGSDPAPGARKTLWVTYTVDGRKLQKRVDEDGQLSIP